ncbi:hypothetical protein BT63DRAFT_458125 [Microthyrium microscopicum]|uniref:Uncharacterized protein n=1 Tax=Microthyrium microscopicum TaxID=703497 RepID=A0A6A6U792_9PEZI|nr:hypothetical protein BT63DRAFT_458125 [Microthyrium microscopicum]
MSGQDQYGQHDSSREHEQSRRVEAVQDNFSSGARLGLGSQTVEKLAKLAKLNQDTKEVMGDGKEKPTARKGTGNGNQGHGVVSTFKTQGEMEACGVHGQPHSAAGPLTMLNQVHIQRLVAPDPRKASIVKVDSKINPSSLRPGYPVSALG